MIDQVKESFKLLYGRDAEILVKAPGRINLIGEHTDYNGGLVLPAAIDRCMYFAFASNESQVGNVYAKDIDESISINLNSLQKTESTWSNYLIGLLLEFQSKGISLKGFDCAFMSDIPIGAGVSSSSALECGFAMGIDALLGSRLDRWQIIEMSHHSNHNFMQIYGGILDQFSSLFGKVCKCMLMDCSDRSFEYHDLNLEGYKIVLINTNVKHEHTTSGYNDRAHECKVIVSKLADRNPKIKFISDADLSMIEDSDNGLSEKLKRRAKYIIEENERVVQFADALKINDVNRLGELLYASHHGLRYDYEVSCSELDLLIELTRKYEAVKGARLMGGGFGGCIIGIVEEDKTDLIVNSIMKEYQVKTGIKPESFFVNASDGAEVFVL